MNTKALKLLVACTLLVSAGAQAASVSLVATSPTTGVVVGDLVTFDVVMTLTGTVHLITASVIK